MAETSDYSGRPLYKKLGVLPSHRKLLIDVPTHYVEWLQAPFEIDSTESESYHFIHLFVTEKSNLKQWLPDLIAMMEPDAMIWISWPKMSSKMKSDVSDGVIRSLALPLGIVDSKVCSVSDVWSGLKFSIRKENRRYTSQRKTK